MSKELTIIQVEGGYITKKMPANEALPVLPNFGSVVKAAREFFGEVIVKGKKDGT